MSGNTVRAKASSVSSRKVRNTDSPEAQEAAILAAAGEEFTAVGVRRANVGGQR